MTSQTLARLFDNRQFIPAGTEKLTSASPLARIVGLIHIVPYGDKAGSWSCVPEGRLQEYI